MKHFKYFEDFLNEALRAIKPNDVETVEVDMSYDDGDREEMKATQASWKKFNLKVKEIKGGQGTEHEVTGKKKDILAYLQSEFYELDDESIEEFYPELLEGNSFKIYTLFLNEGKVSPDKVAKALYGTNANNAPTMTAFLNVRPGDMVTIVSPSLTQGSELLSFVSSMSKGTAWMAEKSVFGSNTLYAAFKNMSQDDFDLLKAQFPKADVVDLDMYEPMKAKAKATASMKKLSNVDSAADASAKY